MTADALPAGWREWPAEAKAQLLARLRAEVAGRPYRREWTPLPHQVPPDDVPTLGMWLMMGGRGTGKTDGGAHYVLDHVNGPPCLPRLPGGHRISIIAPTLGDAIESCIAGPSGLQAYDPRIRVVTKRGGTIVIFPNGAQGKVFGAHTPSDVDRLRAGGNRCLVWMEEWAAMRYAQEAKEQATLGLRLGPHPHFVATTTPRNRPVIRAAVKDATPTGKVRLTVATTYDNPHLEAEVRQAYLEMYEGTRLGRQELLGQLLTDVPGALWTYDRIEAGRVARPPDTLARLVVAVDPAVTSGEGSDETGLVVVGVSKGGCPVCHTTEPHGFVIADLSGRMTPNEWAQAAVGAYHAWSADAIVGEVNNGGDLVESVIRNEDATVRYRAVRASRGKATRAEPVAQLYEKAPPRMHHVGAMPLLEDQMCTWTPDDDTSPDRMDALVWGATDVMLGRRRGFVSVV